MACCVFWIQTWSHVICLPKRILIQDRYFWLKDIDNFYFFWYIISLTWGSVSKQCIMNYETPYLWLWGVQHCFNAWYPFVNLGLHTHTGNCPACNAWTKIFYATLKYHYMPSYSSIKISYRFSINYYIRFIHH